VEFKNFLACTTMATMRKALCDESSRLLMVEQRRDSLARRLAFRTGFPHGPAARFRHSCQFHTITTSGRGWTFAVQVEKIAKFFMKKPFDKDFQIRYSKRKFLHELDRRERRKAKRKSGYKKGKRFSVYSDFAQPLLELLRRKLTGQNIATFDKDTNQFIIKVPSEFSFITNPEETLNTIYSVVDISRQSVLNAIYFDHTKLIDLDIGASAVLDIVTFSLREEWKRRNLEYRLGGDFPQDEMLREILKTMGITKQLNVKGVRIDPVKDKFIVKFPLYRGFKQFRSELGGPQHRDRAITRLVKYLNNCLITASKAELSEEGIRNISRWAGEIITNAEEHSGNNRWFMIGYMQPVPVKESDGERLVGECRLAIFGFGDSIYESLSSEHTPPKTRDAIKTLAQKHTGFFRIFQSYTEQELWTLYALQDGVSRSVMFPVINPGAKAQFKWSKRFIISNVIIRYW
jgi:hypothetical protein